jgi:hypothetical protein
MKPQTVPEYNQKRTNQYKRTESYHRQPHARRADNKLKKVKRKTNHPLAISTVPYPLQQSQRRENSVQSRQLLQDSARIKIVPARHSTQRSHKHTENIYDPARQKNSHGPSTSKINKQETSIIKGKTHTAYKNNKEQRKENLHHKKTNIQRK